MSVRAKSCRRSIPVRERPAYGGSDRAARRDGSEKSRRVERREPRLAHSESPPTFSRGGRRHTDLRSRGLSRAACLAFLVKSYAEEARLVSPQHRRADGADTIRVARRDLRAGLDLRSAVRRTGV